VTAAPSAAPVLPDLGSIREAAAGLVGVALRTPLVESAVLSRLAGVPVFLKCEQLQPIGAFKIRGAYTAIRRLPTAARQRGVVTHSSGNHGIAVGWAARRLGVSAVVVVPDDAPAVKLDAIRGTGAQVVLIPDRSLREPTVERLVQERGLAPIPPFDHPDVMAGQATVGLEILEQLPGVTEILSAVSGGGLLGGIASAVRALAAPIRVVGVEPAGAAKLTAALAAGRPTRIEQPRSMADGLLSHSIGQLNWQAIAPVVREAVTVGEDDLAAAVRFLFRGQGLRVEPSGAAPTAAVLAGRVSLAGPAVLVVSGGNVDSEPFQRLIAE
jgi:threonine dehydratase